MPADRPGEPPTRTARVLGFISQYLDDVLYPDEFLVLSRVLAGVLVLVAYAGAIVRWQYVVAASVRQ